MNAFGTGKDTACDVIVPGGVLTVLEMLIPQVRYPIVTRLRALLFWSVYIVITASALTVFNAMWATLGVRPWIILHGRDWFDYPDIRALGLVATPVALGILGEFFYYWFHRMQHTVPFFWHFHSVHHSLREMSAWNCNHHFTEEIFRVPFVVIPMSLLIGGDVGPVPLVVASVLAMQGLYEHSCIRFGLGPIKYIISDNRYHRIHHSVEPEHRDKNFGSFTPIWDVVFGTAWFPKNEWPQTGIFDEAEPRTISDFLFRPFRRLLPVRRSWDLNDMAR